MRLTTRLLLPLLAVVALVMTVYAAWALRQRQITLGEEARRETRAYATALGLALEGAFRYEALRDVQEIIDRVSREPKIYGVLVYDRFGRLLFVSDPLPVRETAPPELLQGVLRTGEIATFERTLGEQLVFSVLLPIRGPDAELAGAFEVAQPLSFLQQERARTRQRFLLNTLTLLAAVTVLILWLVRRLVARPLERFATAVRALGRGELEYRIREGEAAGELGEVAREFNRMADRLERARSELVRQAEERVELERQLRSTEKMAAVGSLAAGLAHEVAAPLHVIRGRAERLLQRGADPETLRRNLRIIADQIERITVIVRNLLDFARRREPQIAPTDLGEVLDGVVEFLEGEVSRTGIRLVREGPPSGWIRGDAHLLHQVFVNLFMNAVQALEDAGVVGGTVIVRLLPGWGGSAADREPPQEWIVVEVEDTGPGIPEDVLPRVFEPFFTTKPAGRGTGLGLAVVRSIVEEHGGAIEVTNVRPEEGTSQRRGALVRVRLPAAPAPEPAHA